MAALFGWIDRRALCTSALALVRCCGDVTPVSLSTGSLDASGSMLTSRAEIRMKAMSVERPEEITARRIMTDALGVRVERHDDGSEDGMCDFRFRMPDGRLGAAEMTAITDPLAREWAGHRASGLTVPDSSWAWLVKRSRQAVSVKLLKQHLPRIAVLAERADKRDASLLLYDGSHENDPAIQWLRSSGIQTAVSPVAVIPARFTWSRTPPSHTSLKRSTQRSAGWSRSCAALGSTVSSRSSQHPTAPNSIWCCDWMSASPFQTSTGSR